jgi:hypothetical protein
MVKTGRKPLKTEPLQTSVSWKRSRDVGPEARFSICQREGRTKEELLVSLTIETCGGLSNTVMMICMTPEQAQKIANDLDDMSREPI